MTNSCQLFTDLLFYADVGIYQVRILVFDNYQRCPVLLNMQLPVDKKKRKIFEGTTQVQSEAAETPQDMIPTMVP